MKRDESRLGANDIAVGIDLGSRSHSVVVLDTKGHRLTSFSVPHSRKGFEEVTRRCTSPLLLPASGRPWFAFEATSHFWEALAAWFEDQELEYRIVNPLATFRVREARQMGRDKRDVTDAEQIADLLRTGIVTPLSPPSYSIPRAPAILG